MSGKQNRVPSSEWLADVILRRLKQEDLPSLEWEGEYRRFRQVYADTYKRMQRGLASMWVAELPGFGIIGQVFVQFSCDRKELADGDLRAYFFSFRVRPAFRSAGLGTLLLKVIEDEACLNGNRWLCLIVAKENHRAQRFYERNGYKIVADEPGNWNYRDEYGEIQQVHEPAWMMEKKLK